MTTRNIEQRFWRSPLVPWVEWRSTVQSTQAYKLHQHPQLSIGAIIDGETVTRCSGHEYHLSQGDMVLIAPREAHSCNPAAERPRSYHMLYLDEAWCLQQLGFAPGEHLHCAQTVLRNPSFFTAFMHIISLLEDNQTGELQEAVRALLVSLPGLQTAAKPAELCNHMQTTLLADIQQPPSLDCLAQRYTLRKETLIRQFKLATGLTPGAWVNNARVEFAKAQLRAGSDIADAGYQSGFADQSHFHRTFVSFTSSTPRQYAQGRSISDNN